MWEDDTKLIAWKPIFGEAKTDEEKEQQVYFYIVFIMMMLFFFLGMAFIEKYKPKFGHETCYTVILGMVVSLLVYWIKGKELVNVWKFSSDMFFN